MRIGRSFLEFPFNWLRGGARGCGCFGGGLGSAAGVAGLAGFGRGGSSFDWRDLLYLSWHVGCVGILLIVINQIKSSGYNNTLVD